MTESIPAIFENGVFRPLTPVNLPEHERVALVVQPEQAHDQSASPDKLARQKQALAELRKAMDALPCNAPDDGLGGADYKRILYGGPS